jgi:alpha-tubulin suppressor-like RCC1 family protein
MNKKQNHLCVWTIFLATCSFCSGQPCGQIVGWGNNVVGQVTGTKTNTGKITAKDWNAVGVIKIDGQILSNIVSISAGETHGLALRNDGTVFGWGGNTFGEATGKPSPERDYADGPVIIDGQPLNKVKTIAAGRNHSVALKKDGTVVAWGKTPFSTPSGLSNVVAIAAGVDASLALKEDGTVVDWQRKSPKRVSNVIAIEIAKWWGGAKVALKNNGTVIEWYGDAVHNVDGATNVVAIAAGKGHRLALKRDGTVLHWGNDAVVSLVSINGVILTNVTAISAGIGYNLALKNDGTITSWGEMGLSSLTVPDGLTNAIAVSAGGFSMAITTNSAVAERFRQPITSSP